MNRSQARLRWWTVPLGLWLGSPATLSLASAGVQAQAAAPGFVERSGLEVSGGGAATAGTMTMTDTAGQAAVGWAGSADYAMTDGFWGALDTGPVLAPIADATIDEGLLLTFTPASLEEGIPSTFSLHPGAPSGTAIHPRTGQFAWTPSEAQGPGTYAITVQLTDDLTPSLIDLQAFVVTVLEVNRAPVPGTLSIATQSGVPAKITYARILAAATDADDDRLTLTGVTPTTAQGGTARSDGLWVIYDPPPGTPLPDALTYQLTDGRVVVAGVIRLETATQGDEPAQNLLRVVVRANTDVQLDFLGVPGYAYRLQACADLAAPHWQDVGTATADRYGRVRFLDLEGASHPARYYRTVHP